MKGGRVGIEEGLKPNMSPYGTCQIPQPNTQSQHLLDGPGLLQPKAQGNSESPGSISQNHGLPVTTGTSRGQ